MRLPRRILFTIAALLVALFLTPSAQAVLASRVFMSTNGNDANNCANPNTPCLTFAGSLAQVAVGGEVIAEATGGYGAISVTKSVTISGPPGVVIYSGLQVNVNAPGATVVLRGLTIDGTGTTTGSGINVTAVSFLHVESCVVTGFAGTSGTDGNGIYFASAGQLFVKDTIVRGNGSVGIYVIPSPGTAHVSVDHCRLEANQWGLLSGSNAKTAIRDSVASGNSATGLQQAQGGDLTAEGCLVADNGTGLEVVGLSIFRASNCTITDNGTGLLSVGLGSSLQSRSNNTVEGNGTNGTFDLTYPAR